MNEEGSSRKPRLTKAPESVSEYQIGLDEINLGPYTTEKAERYMRLVGLFASDYPEACFKWLDTIREASKDSGLQGSQRVSTREPLIKRLESAIQGVYPGSFVPFTGDPHSLEEVVGWSRQITDDGDLKGLMMEHQKVVYDGLLHYMGGQDDLCHGETLQEALDGESATVWEWVYNHLDDLLDERTARTTTRIRAFAVWVGRSWKTRSLRRKRKYVPLAALNTLPSRSTALIAQMTPKLEQAPKITALYCHKCRYLQKAAQSDDTDTVVLSCGHSRQLNAAA